MSGVVFLGWMSEFRPGAPGTAFNRRCDCPLRATWMEGKKNAAIGARTRMATPDTPTMSGTPPPSTSTALRTRSGGDAGKRRFATYARFVLAFATAVVLCGAGVRATGSGAGCGDQWPLCNGVWLPHARQAQTIIELTHRITSGPTLGMLVLGLIVFAFRSFPARHPTRLFAVLALLFTGTEALIGAALVLLGHVGTNTSPNRAYTLAIHLINTMVLLAVLALTAWFASAPPIGRTEPSTERPVSRILLACGLLAFLTISVSGVIAALGDTLFASNSLTQGIQQDLAPSAHIFVRLRVWHPIVAAVLGCFLIGSVAGLVIYKGLAPVTRRLALAVVFLTFVQAGLGAMNVLLLAPVWMQLAHLFVADLLWLALVLMSAEIVVFGRRP